MSEQEELVPEIVILDFETEGLDERRENILECHVIHVNNQTLEIVSEFGMVLTERQNTNPHHTVNDMHKISGLFDEISALRTAGIVRSATDLDIALLRFFQSVHPEPKHIMLAGNSVGGFDLQWCKRYCPKATRHLHHRVIDVSGFLEIYKLWFGPLPAPVKQHRARADCFMSLETLRLAHKVGYQWRKEYG